MPALELHHVNGTVDRRELSRSQALSIGKQSFNDVCVPDEGVGAMHCRVLWNKSTFEVTAATASGVEVNGTTVSHAKLQPGDVIRVGSLDLVYVDDTAVAESIEFTGVRESSQPPPEPVPRHPKKQEREPRASAVEEKPKPKESATAAPKAEDLSLFEGPVYTESQAIEVYEGKEDLDEKPIPVRKPAAVLDRGAGIALASRARPGEQDIFRSPLVLGLSVGGLVLVLVTGIFWFLIGREQASRLFDRAVAELNDGQYAQSIASFEQFLQQYPGHSLHRQAERGLDRALVQKEIAGATPAWKKGLEQLQALISHHQNEPDFKDMHSQIHRYGEEISLGSARTAESARDPDLLTVSEDAQVILERFADPASPPAATLARIKEARVAAVIAIGKQKLFDDGMAAVDAALASKKPMVALGEREKLVRAFDGFASHKRVKDALQKALDLERSLVVADDTERAAESMDVDSSVGLATLGLFHTRTRADESSQGRVAYVLAKDSCYAIDSVTGELTWRRAIGFDAPFLPVPVSGTQEGILMYDSNSQNLLCCQPGTGKLIWRQKLGGRPRSAPLIHEGQIYLPTDDRSLCRIDVETGRLTERLVFSQNIQGPPTLTLDGNHLLVPGEAAMIYALSMRPLAAAATTFTDHAAGSIAAPPLALGKLFLLCENDKADSAILRLWDASVPKAPLRELTTKALRVRGQVRESPVLRGNQLIVPSSGEQLAAFSVTDEPGRESLAPIGTYRVRDKDDAEKQKEGSQEAAPEAAIPQEDKIGRRIPLFVALGSDRQFWAASSAFRRLEIGADAIHMDSKSVAPGIASQRLQLIGDQFYVGRKGTFHDAVVFSAVDRDRMIIPWRTVLGTQFLDVSTSRDQGVFAVTEAGQIVLIGPDRLRQGGFDLKAAIELELPNGIQQKLIAATLHDGRMFVAAVGDTNQAWIIGTGGQLDLNSKLAKTEQVQAGAVLLDAGLVLPLPGRLKVVPFGSGKKSIQDWIAPVGDKPSPPWKFLLRLDGDELLACHSSLIARMQVRTTDVPHLAEAAKIQLPQPIEVQPALKGDSILIAETSGTVQLLNKNTFDQDGKREFVSPVRGVWSTEASWFAWSGDGKLHSFKDGRDLPTRWSFDLKGLEPAGTPVEDVDQVWVACRDGTVVAIHSQNGSEMHRLQVPQSITFGLKKFDGQWFAIACDGTLYRLDLATAKPVQQ